MARFEENVEIVGASLILKEPLPLAPVVDAIAFPEKLRVQIKPKDDTLTIFDRNEKPVLSFNSSDAALAVGGNGVEGDIRVNDSEGRLRVHINGSDGSIHLRDTSGNDRVRLGTGDGAVTIFDGEGHRAFRLDSSDGVLDVGTLGESGVEGDIRVADGEGRVRVHIDGHDGTIKLRDITTDIGAFNATTLAVEFEIEDSSLDDPEGTVMVINASGKLERCTAENDKRVVGVLLPAAQGIVLGHKPASGQNRRAVAIAGKVNCRVFVKEEAIPLGGPLSTSKEPGHAQPMAKFQNRGTLLGKALRAVDVDVDETETIPILLTLGG